MAKLANAAGGDKPRSLILLTDSVAADRSVPGGPGPAARRDGHPAPLRRPGPRDDGPRARRVVPPTPNPIPGGGRRAACPRRAGGRHPFARKSASSRVPPLAFVAVARMVGQRGGPRSSGIAPRRGRRSRRGPPFAGLPDPQPPRHPHAGCGAVCQIVPGRANSGFRIRGNRSGYRPTGARRRVGGNRRYRRVVRNGPSGAMIFLQHPSDGRESRVFRGRSVTCTQHSGKNATLAVSERLHGVGIGCSMPVMASSGRFLTGVWSWGAIKRRGAIGDNRVGPMIGPENRKRN